MSRSAPGETYGKPLVVLDQLAREAVRLGDRDRGTERPRREAVARTAL